MKVPFMKQVAWCLTVAIFLLGIVPRANAGFAPSTIVLSESERAQDLETVRQALETKIVRERLLDFGFTEEEVAKKLSLLSDEELHQLAVRADEIRVGGDGAVAVILILVIAFLAYLIYTDQKVVITK